MPASVERHGPWALVAGASEGLGAAFSEALAVRGFDLVLVARRAQPLEQLAASLRERFDRKIQTVPLDLARPDAAELLVEACEGLEVGLIVYNAAAAPIGPFLDTSTEQKRAAIDVNCRGPVELVSAFAPAMTERGRGGIVLMSSLTGLVGTAMVTTYGATKGFLQILGEGLWEELGPHGIDVLTSTAGAILTPNFQRQTPDDQQASAMPQSPEQVAEATLDALGHRPVVVPGWMNTAVAWVLTRWVPRSWAIRFMSKNTRALYQES